MAQRDAIFSLIEEKKPSSQMLNKIIKMVTDYTGDLGNTFTLY